MIHKNTHIDISVNNGQYEQEWKTGLELDRNEKCVSQTTSFQHPILQLCIIQLSYFVVSWFGWLVAYFCAVTLQIGKFVFLKLLQKMYVIQKNEKNCVVCASENELQRQPCSVTETTIGESRILDNRKKKINKNIVCMQYE